MSDKPAHPNGSIGTATITVPVLRTHDGQPTCALHIGHTHTRCPFLRLQGMGMSGICVLAQGGLYPDSENGTGFLRPAKDCPIHRTSSRYPNLVTSKEQPNTDQP